MSPGRTIVPLVFACAIAAGAASGGAAVAEIDETKLPPPAARPVRFAADIKPIFERSCVRCHGAERPKSRFSLATREAALRGGENGVAIVPQAGARSPLIHYVAGLVPEMEMPPEGKGTPLTAEEIGLLRAWIDQGASWDDELAGDEHVAEFSFTPALRWVTVRGNAQRFQQHHWIRRRGAGGVADFRIAQKLTNGVYVAVEGRALTDDYRVTLDVRKPDVGFARFGVEQYRRYYDDTGPYYPFAARGFATQAKSIYDLGRELYLDQGTAFAEFGLTIPDWPQITVGYDFHYKDASKSIQQWGPVTQTTGGSNIVRNIFPAYKNVDEEVHVVRLDVTHEIGGVVIEDNLRAAFSNVKTKRFAAASLSPGAAYPDAFTITREEHDQVQIANSIQGSKPVKDWLFVSAGYLFSDLQADASLRQHSADGAGRPAPGTFWLADQITIEERSHVFNANGQAGPFDGLTGAVGLQAALTDRSAYGATDLREGDPNDPTFPVVDPAFVRSDTDRLGLEETAIVRYTRLPATVLFADARWRQEQLSIWEEQAGGHHEFLTDSEVHQSWQEYKAGFDVSPWRYAALHASYRKRLFLHHYDREIDQQPQGSAGDGYPGFIRSRDTDTDVADARLVLKPALWLKATLSYQLASTDYETATDASATTGTPRASLLAGRHNASTYSANVTATPFRRWSISTTVSWQESDIDTKDNGDRAVEEYRGHIFSVLTSATFLLDRSTDVTASYSYSQARYGQGNAPAGLPLGIDYDLHGIHAGVRKRFSPHVAASVQYGFFDYTEPSAGGLNDYTAHTVFALVNMILP